MRYVQELIREFCVRQLAQFLFENVECSHADRAELDWLTAERHAHHHSSFRANVFKEFQDLMKARGIKIDGHHKIDDLPESVDTSYDALQEMLGRSVWDNLFLLLSSEMEPYLINPARPQYTALRSLSSN